MGYKVDEEYYCNACDYLATQATKLEADLEAFKTTCDGLFNDNYYGDNVQTALKSRYTVFYQTLIGKLNAFTTSVSSTTSDFLDSIETDDVLS